MAVAPVQQGSVGIDWLAPSTVIMFIAFHASTAIFMGAAVYWALFTDGHEHARRWGMVAFLAVLLGSIVGAFVVFAVYYRRTGELPKFYSES